MKPFFKATYDLSPAHIDAVVNDLVKNFNYTKEAAFKQYMESIQGELYKNDKYTVLIREMKYPNFPDMLWLSIKRNDKLTIHDWRELQEIKNMLVGKEHEAVELYPADSRVVDTANQYHLWVMADNKFKFPFGFHEGRIVSDKPGAAGAVQRKFTVTP